MKKYAKYIKPTVFIVAIILAVVLGRHFGYAKFFGSDSISALKALVNANLAEAMLIYLAAVLLGCLVPVLPGVTFGIAAGVAFGPWLGTACCSVATTAGAGLAFLVGRFFLRDSLKPVVMKNRYLKKWLFDDPDRNASLLLMITRLVPLFPFNLQNFAYGITDVPFGKYMLYSFIFMLPGTAAYTIGSAGLADGTHRTLYFILAAVLAVTVTLVGRHIKKRYVTPQKAELPMPNAACISCGKCTDDCAFLKRHGLDFSKAEPLYALAEHCFLCRECTDVCPAGVDGAAYMLALRRARVRANGGNVRGNLATRMEKTNYVFKNYRHATAGTVLFPGCNYPSFYPESTKKLVALFKSYGMGTVFDCCGKPMAELGCEEDEQALLSRLEKNLKKRGISEIVTVCPNCYAYLNGRLDVKVTTVYNKLMELGIGSKVEADRMLIFRPCPDRAGGLWLKDMAARLTENYACVEDVQCCGLGGGAAPLEKQAASEMVERVRTCVGADRPLYVYCASCAGRFTRCGITTRHLLNEMIGSNEKADVKRSVLNRAGFKFF